ncbi:pentatricopeptide repeat-containing protein At1g08070, chloroplastic-like [Aristolochia californica]|uniref:pentatricopeptide repeat-containing protein At1g08070, chloroplastic-like n=1 Tax=Aristolochia californica TaxID=171875 RepID=UPI0035E1CA42
MYSKCFNIGSAREVFDDMLEKDLVSWNSIISGYVYNGDVAYARELFEKMEIRRNEVSWTALINGYGREGMVVDMFKLFRRMLVTIDNVKLNSTLVCLLSACSYHSNFELGRWVSVFIDVNRIPLDMILATALISMYLRYRDLGKARRIFDGIPSKTLAMWNAMITGCVHGGLFEEAIQLFYLLQENQIRPDEITMVNMLSACASLGALELGREIHLSLGRSRLQLNEILVTALVDMYSKCGSIKDACLVFVKSNEKDAVLWNAFIIGLATHGHGRDSLAVFSQMERSRTQPNEVTFIGVLSACTHSGLVEEGRANFEIMQTRYNLKPKIEHYSCMVDLLGRAGYLEEAMNLIKSMNVEPDSVIWGSLLSACGVHQNVELADEVGKTILSSETPNVGCCILLSNIYASSSRWEDVARVRRLMKNTGMKKPSGGSWIEVDGVVSRFLVEDTSHPRCDDIYEMHEILVNQLEFEGFASNLDFVLMDDDGT